MPKIRGAIIGCLIMLLITMPLHAGFMLFYYIPFIVIATFWNGYSIYRKPKERRVRLTKLGLWFLSFTVVFSSHYYRHIMTRVEANHIVEKIELFHSKNARYPTSLDEIGVTRSALRDKIGFHRYLSTDNHPSFFYGVTYVIYDTYRYNFETKSWEYN